MKFRIALLWPLLALPCIAQAPLPALPLEGPPPSPPAPVAPAAGVVPGVRLQSNDKIGRTYAEGNPFIVWGGTRNQRASLFTAAGLVRQSVLEALHLPDTWSHPIIIQLRDPMAPGTETRPPVWTVISQVEGGFRIEVNVAPQRQSVPGPLLRENLARAVLADQVLQGKERLNLNGAATPPPDWLLHGTLALIDYRELGRMSDTFSRIFRLGRVLSVQDILNADPAGMDSISMTIYRVSCGALLMMLVEQPKGPEYFSKLLATLVPGGADQAILIERAYPALGGSANSLSKWWSLQIAALSQPGMEELQRPAETARQLTEALTLHFTPPAAVEKKPRPLDRLFSSPKPADTGKPAATTPAPAPVTCDIAEHARVLTSPDRASVFDRVDLALTKLMLRSHPVYRPIIVEYQSVARQLAKGKTGKNLPATLKRLATTRERLAATLQGIEDHMDWYEATQSSTFSGAFEDYLKAAEELEKPRPARPDPISRYLDEVEREFVE